MRSKCASMLTSGQGADVVWTPETQRRYQQLLPAPSTFYPQMPYPLRSADNICEHIKLILHHADDCAFINNVVTIRYVKRLVAPDNSNVPTPISSLCMHQEAFTSVYLCIKKDNLAQIATVQYERFFEAYNQQVSEAESAPVRGHAIKSGVKFTLSDLLKPLVVELEVDDASTFLVIPPFAVLLAKFRVENAPGGQSQARLVAPDFLQEEGARDWLDRLVSPVEDTERTIVCFVTSNGFVVVEVVRSLRCCASQRHIGRCQIAC